MLMTSSFRVEARRAVLRLLGGVAGVILGSYSQPGEAVQPAPDAPRAAPAMVDRQPPGEERSARMASVELTSVSVRRPDATQKKMAGPVFLKQATDPLMIEVQTQQPLPSQPRTSSPIIVLNGEKLVDTWMILPDKLVAFLPNRSKLKGVNSVAVVWLGNEEATLTKRPLNFRRLDLPR